MGACVQIAQPPELFYNSIRTVRMRNQRDNVGMWALTKRKIFSLFILTFSCIIIVIIYSAVAVDYWSLIGKDCVTRPRETWHRGA